MGVETYDGIKSTMKAIKNPTGDNIKDAAIDSLGVIPYVKPLKYVSAKYIQGAGASAGHWLGGDINNSLGYLKIWVQM